MDELTNPVLVESFEGFDVYFTALVEHASLDDAFDSTVTDIDELAQKIDNYDLVYFCAKVTVYHNDIELASDYLGCCCYESYEEFYTKYKDDCYADMRSTAIAEAKKAIAELKKIDLYIIYAHIVCVPHGEQFKYTYVLGDNLGSEGYEYIGKNEHIGDYNSLLDDVRNNAFMYREIDIESVKSFKIKDSFVISQTN